MGRLSPPHPCSKSGCSGEQPQPNKGPAEVTAGFWCFRCSATHTFRSDVCALGESKWEWVYIRASRDPKPASSPISFLFTYPALNFCRSLRSNRHVRHTEHNRRDCHKNGYHGQNTSRSRYYQCRARQNASFEDDETTLVDPKSFHEGGDC